MVKIGNVFKIHVSQGSTYTPSGANAINVKTIKVHNQLVLDLNVLDAQYLLVMNKQKP